MKKLMNYSGDMIIGMLVMGMIFTFVLNNMTDANGNKGLFNILASYENIKIYNYSDFQDIKSTISYAKIEKPNVKLNTETQIIAGQSYAYSDLFSLQQPEKTIKSINVVSVKTKDGVDYSSSIDKTNKNLSFGSAGTYTVEVKIIDTENISATRNVNVSVNR